MAKKEALVEKLRLKIKAYDSKLIDNSVKQIIDTARRFEAKIIGPIP
ncbi:MAG: 30S ribosomal protein S10, partial [Patescibacteria group bacterium]